MLRKLVDLVGIYLSHRVLEHNGRDHARLVLAAFFLIRNRVIEEIIESLSADRVSKGGGQACVNVGQHRLEHSRDGQQFLPDGGDAHRKLDLAGPPHPANPAAGPAYGLARRFNRAGNGRPRVRGSPGVPLRAVNFWQQCPLWVKSGHRGRSRRCPLLPPKANIDACGWNVRFVPIADIV